MHSIVAKRMLNKSKLALIIVILGSTVIGGFSIGLMISTETIGNTGVIVKPPPPPIIIPPSGGGTPSPPPPEPVIDVEVYQDINCSSEMVLIDWGTIEAGKVSYHDIYVKNLGEIEVFLSLQIEDWEPSDLSNYVDITWDYDNTAINVGEVRHIVIEFSVDSDSPEITNFGFNFVIVAS